MKKILSMLLIASIFLITGQVCYADDTGIMIIGGNEGEAETVSLDDFKIGDIAEIEGYGEVGLNTAYWTDSLPRYNTSTRYGFNDWIGLDYYESGPETKYLRLWLDVLNTSMTSHDFCKDFDKIICTYDDKYQFGGWVRQHDVIEDGKHSLFVLNNKEGGTPVGVMYRGEYSVVITLPRDVYTRVTEEGKPLTVTFNLGENEFTYIWRDT